MSFGAIINRYVLPSVIERTDPFSICFLYSTRRLDSSDRHVFCYWLNGWFYYSFRQWHLDTWFILPSRPTICHTSVYRTYNLRVLFVNNIRKHEKFLRDALCPLIVRISFGFVWYLAFKDMTHPFFVIDRTDHFRILSVNDIRIND